MHKLFSYFANKHAISGKLPKMWEADRISIYDFLNTRSAAESFQDLPLPDEEKIIAVGGMQWVPGGLDGAFGHHGGSGGSNAEDVFSALQRACKSLTANNLQSLYSSVMKVNALENADNLVSTLSESSSINTDTLFRIALWLATQSPDREPVKFGIVLLGIFEVPSPPLDVLMTLGRHDEFSLYAAIALRRAVPESQRDLVLFQLAQQVSGWGRVQIVERLAETSDPDIKAWMLREGYKNGVMYEYLAYTCAVNGDLLPALRQEAFDDALLKGAGDILQALINGGPAEGILDYADAPEVTRLFVERMEHHPSLNLDDFLALNSIKFFVDDDEHDGEEIEPLGWVLPLRQEISNVIARIQARPDWAVLVEQGLEASDGVTFSTAAQAAQYVGIDPWESRFKRQKAIRDSSEWFFLMRSNDASRISRAVELAELQLDIEKIASGPGLELGLGPDFTQHGALDFVLQELDRFPKIGEKLVRAGLQSPVVRNRNFALKALSAWGHENWSPDLVQILNTSVSREPDDGVRERMQNVLSRKPN